MGGFGSRRPHPSQPHGATRHMATLRQSTSPYGAGASHLKEWPADQLERGQPCPPLPSISPPSERCPRRSPKAIALICPRSNRFTSLRAICEAPALRGRAFAPSRSSCLDRGHSCPPHVCRNDENERTRMSAVPPNPAPLFHMRSPCPAGEVNSTRS